MTIQLRSIAPDDRDFLYRVYASTRYEELAPLNWDAATVDGFLTMQFNAQHLDYQGNYPNASFDLILQDDVPIGRLYVDRRPDELHIIDIALLPEYRNQGVGSAFLNQLIAEAEVSNLPVRIYVERFNPALRLYTRLGFQPIGDTGVYFLMERPAHAAR
jgi:ribosomal protein S18 acetylase RimI-like enzyme